MSATITAESIRTEILEILIGLLQQQTGQDLHHHPEDLKRLQVEAANLHRILDGQEVAPVKLENFQGHHFKSSLQRSTVQAWLKINAPAPNYTQPPQRCPSCNNLLLDKWQCTTCGLILDSPEYQRLKQTASLDPRGDLPLGYLLIPDPKRRRLLFLSTPTNHEVVWQINFDLTQCQEPVSAQFLPNKLILVVDRKGHGIFLCDRFGNKHWTFETNRSEHHVLSFPSKAYYCPLDGENSYLVVDQGHHRVLRINEKHEIVWSYGITGQVGSGEGFLNSPSDIQRTPQGTYLIADTGNHRVIEINPLSQKIIWKADPQEGLISPVCAQRLLNGRTQILDAGQHRILELDQQSTILEECVYFKAEMDPRFRIDEPLQMIRRENQNLVIQNEDRIFEVMLLHKQLQWFSLLTDLRLKHLLKLSEATQETPPTKTSAPTLVRSAFNLPETLRRVSVFKEAPEEFFEKIKLCMRFEDHPAGKILVREGQRGDAMYIIRRGTVEVIKDFQVVAQLHEGEIFGEMALVLSEPRNATVKTQTACQLYKLNKLAFETVIHAIPEVYEKVRKMAEARKTVTELKNNTEFQGTEQLHNLMESHKQRLQELRNTRLKRPSQMTTQPSQMRMIYTPIDQHIMQEAKEQGFTLLEMHIRIHPRCRMKSVRISLLVMILEKHGTVIKMNPSADDILQDKLDLDVSLTLVTQSSRSEVLEDASAIAEIEDVSVIPI
ncbi:hypothetical protein COW36_09515 [bacterium (Candidatus Blackallbacteria) CG17_big_fil_post_rev_8_21_14_2_50_48_46]|uniref:Cyclic nucleotide-binding domain-containing protein n=1 Tax=bacterium (Candidatus Blackallbacteria) CG17_big_fil_post_rev_8_21_14_2_50_48_46 TaxID=2014261 RepID=A0A2M7G6E1_9BACT|nr:MAG: hypothetical protein COW64_01895 [bacterium (Candidatus Blackallbacteria) CG18_big_fil_WC_8_21_14_2_50_49_26]PIW17200.1 MAG: hypothetical protein COW36_09515 [bacterium (Candidatus Blackallbacteria) CG17_big_fil_post_rev_8_21_14_2_50_48_46]PIW50991.1 MAG: hypothetical protein COW20_00525 [bacterium (Candidatus Blackallbacteria) CG13_big_fil_rev_8_21_14_2_50_49_14]